MNTSLYFQCCKVAPLAGETKVWQYVTLFKRVNLIDCPGIVSNTSDSNADMICKGVVRMEMVPNPSAYIDPIIQKIKPQYLTQAYKVTNILLNCDIFASFYSPLLLPSSTNLRVGLNKYTSFEESCHISCSRRVGRARQIASWFTRLTLFNTLYNIV